MQPIIFRMHISEVVADYFHEMASIQTYTGARAENNSKVEADEGVDNKSRVERPENDVCYLRGQCTLFLSFLFFKEPFLRERSGLD